MTEVSVSQQVTWFEQDSGMSHIVSSTLSWHARDPFAMTVVFNSEVDVEWKFALDLFADVVESRSECAGEGDVRVTKTIASDGEQLLVRLSSPFGTVELRAAMHNPKAFIKAVNETSVLSEDYDIDTALTKLLNGNYE